MPLRDYTIAISNQFECVSGSKKMVQLRPLHIFLGFVVAMCLCVQEGLAQNRFELGPFTGAGYYFGDLNPAVPFRNAHFAFGAVGRYNYTDRIAFKATATLTDISGQYPQKGLLFPVPDGTTYLFSRTLMDLAAQVELNFLSYDHPFVTKTRFTPFLSVGMATTIYKRYGDELQNEEDKTVFLLSLPFGVGVKYKLTSWIRVSAEYSFRKTFVDDLDLTQTGLEVNPDDPYGFDAHTYTHNNDWYAFAGISVTFSFSKRKLKCYNGY